MSVNKCSALENCEVVPMKRLSRLLRIFHIPAPIVFSLSLLLSACAANKAQPDVPTTMSPTVLALYNEGNAFVQQKDFDRAEDRFKAALSQARLVNDEFGIAMSLAWLGANYSVQKRHSDAVESLQEALLYFRKLKNRPSEALTLGAIGIAEANRGNDAQALTYFADGLEIAEQLFPMANESEKQIIRSHRAGILVLKAKSAENLTRFTEAVESYQAAAKDFLALDNKESAGLQLWVAAELSSKIGAAGKALELFSEASSIYQTAGNTRNAIWTKIGMGRTQFDLRRYEEALATLSEASLTAEREGQSDLAAGTMSFLAEIDENLGEFENALTKYRSALQNYRKDVKQGDPTVEARIFLRMGKIYRLLDRYEEAVENFQLAISKARLANARDLTASAVTNLAEVFDWLADANTSVRYYKQALDLFRQEGDGPKQVEILATLGELAFLTKDVPPEETRAYFNEAATILAEHFRVSDKDLKESEANERRIKRYTTGDENWRLAAALLFQKVGRVSVEAKDLDRSILTLNEALSFHVNLRNTRDISFETAKDLYFLAAAYFEKKDFASSLKYLQIAEQIGVRLRTPEIHWVYAALGRIYAELNETDKARQYYQKGFELLESIQAEQGLQEFKMGVFDKAITAYHSFIEFLFDLHQKDHDERHVYEAFHYNERARARVFLEMIGNSLARRGPTQQTLSSKQEEKTLDRITTLHQRLRDPKLDSKTENELLDELTRIRETQRSAILVTKGQHQNYSQATLPRPVTGEQIQAVLDSHTVVLEYAPVPQQTILWAITKDQFKAYKLEDREGAVLVDEYLRTLHAPLMGADEIKKHTELGRQLYRILVEPAEEIIREKRHLIIVPAGLLSYLPFEALIAPDTEKSRLEIQYLIKKFEITYAPSASVLVAQRATSVPNRLIHRLPLAAFGDPIYRAEGPSKNDLVQDVKIANMALRGLDLRRLEFAGDEVLRIAQIWGVNRNSEHINLRDKATVDRVRRMDLAKYKIVHFAAHAILADEVKRVFQPALVLSQTENDENKASLLQFSDILGLKLDADLVVLSACDTGLGTLKNGEGIIGLTRAFLYAGASSTVVSLWTVQDQSTSLLMEHFYKNLKRGLSKAEALRQAKLEIMRSKVNLKATGMRQDLASPFYWAPFILVGDWEPIRDK